MGQGHHHGDPSEIGERRLWWAVLADINAHIRANHWWHNLRQFVLDRRCAA